jgi:hypothetical protein
MQLGIGELSASSNGLEWIGHVVDAESRLCLKLPLGILSDIRAKQDPDESCSFLLVTVTDSLFVQFKIHDWERCSDLVDSLKKFKIDASEKSIHSENPISSPEMESLEDWYR